MRHQALGISMGRAGRSVRAALALGLVLILAAAQGAPHTHAAGPDAAQCAVCHWGEVETPPAPPALAPSTPVPGFVATPETPDAPHGDPERWLHPVRGPPTLA